MLDNLSENRIKLTPYYVAYMDILGVKDLIKSENSDVYLNKIQQLYSETMTMVQANCYNSYKLNPKIKIFSDNIIITIPKAEFMETSVDSMNSCYIMMFAAFFQIIALKYSLLIRGSVVSDKLYIDDYFVFGSALSKAYDLESNVAIYPRVVINPENISQFIQSDYQKKILTKDYSNIYYINSFECFFKYISANVREENLKIIKKVLESKLCNENNNKINTKICWLINMYNDFCQNNNYSKYCINIDDYPYNPYKLKTIVSGNIESL